MSYDVLFLLGVFLLPFAVLSMMGAWVGGRSPRTGGILGMVALVLLIYVAQSRPAGLYDLRDIPALTVAVFGRLLG